MEIYFNLEINELTKINIFNHRLIIMTIKSIALFERLISLILKCQLK